jgi:hypothetical protein
VAQPARSCVILQFAKHLPHVDHPPLPEGPRRGKGTNVYAAGCPVYGPLELQQCP